MTVINGLPAHAFTAFSGRARADGMALVSLARSLSSSSGGIDPRRPPPWPWPRAGPAFGLLMPNALLSPML
jgi:hypothetical protein